MPDTPPYDVPAGYRPAKFNGAYLHQVGPYYVNTDSGLKVGLPVLEQHINYTPGGDTLVATMKAAGAYTAVVSGGFTAITGPPAVDATGQDGNEWTQVK